MKTSLFALSLAYATLAGCSQAAVRTPSLGVCQAGGPTAGCSQLQSSARIGSGFQLGHARVPLSLAGDTKRHASFLELGRSKVMATRLLHGYARFERASSLMDKRVAPSAQELSDTISKLLEDQGSAPVGCASRLKEAEANLKKLHGDIKATALALRTSKKACQSVDTEMKDTAAGIEALEEKRSRKLAACDDKSSSDRRMLETLQNDMREMRSVRNGVATASATTNMAMVELSTFLRTSSTNMSLVDGPKRTDHAQQLLTRTKVASLDMHNCLRDRPQTEASSLIELGQDMSSMDILRLADSVLQTPDADLDSDDKWPEDDSPATTQVQSQSRVKPQFLLQPQSEQEAHPRQPEQSDQATAQPEAQPQTPIKLVRIQPTLPPVAPAVTESAHCAAERQRLQDSYKQAYQALTREVASYQELVEDKSCAHAEEGEYQEELRPLQQRESELSGQLAIAVGEVEKLRPELETLRSAHAELQERIDTLHSECDALVKTKERLRDTKEVIKAMGDCAGLEGASGFNLPCWVGRWANADLDEAYSIEEADAAMNAVCADRFGAHVRAAEVSEVDTGSIAHMPERNDAQMPLLPICPRCGTREARVCWDSGAMLEHKGRRTGCDAEGLRAVLCVSEGPPSPSDAT